MESSIIEWFKGDLEGLGVLAYLGTTLKAGKAHRVSIRNLSIETGIGRERLRNILAALDKRGCISFEIYSKHASVVVNQTNVVGFQANMVGFATNVVGFQASATSGQDQSMVGFQANGQEPPVRRGKEDLSLTPPTGFVQSASQADKLRLNPPAAAEAPTPPTAKVGQIDSSACVSPETSQPDTDRPGNSKPSMEDRPAAAGSLRTARSKKKHATDEDRALAADWLDLANTEMKWQKPKSGWTEENFSESIAKIRRRTGLTHDQMKAVLHFIKNDDFWRPNCLSPSSMLKKSKDGTMRKIDHILNRIRSGNKTMIQLEKISKWTEEELRESRSFFEV